MVVRVRWLRDASVVQGLFRTRVFGHRAVGVNMGYGMPEEVRADKREDHARPEENYAGNRTAITSVL